MGINNYKSHLLILSEDDAYRDIVNGFLNGLLQYNGTMANRIHVEKPAGGWKKLLDSFTRNYERDLRKYPARHVLMLLDLDGRDERLQEVRDNIPPEIHERVFVLCCKDEAECVKGEMGHGKFESIGERLAQSCCDDTGTDLQNPWTCPQLQHNEQERRRLATKVHSFHR